LAAVVLAGALACLFRNSLLIEYHKQAILESGPHSFLRNHISSDEHVQALVRLGYLVQREYRFSPPLSENEVKDLSKTRIPAKFAYSWWVSENHGILHVTARPDDMTRIQEALSKLRMSGLTECGPTNP